MEKEQKAPGCTSDNHECIIGVSFWERRQSMSDLSALSKHVVDMLKATVEYNEYNRTI